MAEVVVVGAGLGGLAAAARLAKLGHHVTVFERTDSPGGLLRRVTHGSFSWDATPLQTSLPAVLRDLFRKSGRPLERYVDLGLSVPARRHLFADGSRLDLPSGSRAAQLEAVGAVFGTRAAQTWTGFVDDQEPAWDLMRSLVLDAPAGASVLADRRTAKSLHTGRSLDHVLRKTFRDERLRLVAAYPVARTGGRAAVEPAFRTIDSYVERTFGVWRSPAGAADLTGALLTRMSERAVDVRLGTEVTALSTSGTRVSGVRLADGEPVEAAVVVAAVAPHQVFSRLLEGAPGASGRGARAAALFAPPRAGVAPAITYLGLRGTPPDLPCEVVLHGDPLIVLTTEPSAPDGHQAATVVSHGSLSADVLDTMATRGLDIRGQVVERVEAGGRSSYPLAWDGPATAAERAALARPLPGLHCLGTGLVLGPSVPYVAWQAAHLADLVGKA